jgi:heme/copper-type cytochrome/quinol oxidase subunit 4
MVPRRIKATDFTKKQEKVLEKMAFVTLFNLALMVLLTSIQLIISKTTDMMIPFKMLIIMGFCYLLANSTLSVYFHVKQKRFGNPQTLFLKILAAVGLIFSTAYALPSAFMLTATFHLNYSLDFSFIAAFGAGIFATLVGMALTASRSIQD